METEFTKRLRKSAKNKILEKQLELIRNEQSDIYCKLTELLKLNSDMIQFVSQPVKKSA